MVLARQLPEHKFSGNMPQLTLLSVVSFFATCNMGLGCRSGTELVGARLSFRHGASWGSVVVPAWS